jgi:glycosyltransferase involved in cell wall biosynthesis
MRIHQLLSGAGPHDAITSEAISFRARFSGWGWGGRDYAVHVAPGLNGHIRMLKRFKPRPDDVLLLHHSAGAPRLRELLQLPNRKLLLYHNVTPAPWFWEHAPNVAVQCAVGREQLSALVRAVDLAAADSHFNAAELQHLGATRTAVIPLLVDYTRLGPPRPEPTGPPGPPTILFVGRLSPHKHQDEVIRAFASYRRSRAPEARLTLVGDPISSRYLDFLRNLADILAPGAVSIESGLSNAELGERYRAAHAFLCLSAHEGFCIPVLEALSQGVPVIARPAGAIPETAGDAALLVEDPDLAVVAELLHLAVTDVDLRTELRRRGAARVAHYSPDQVADELRKAVEGATRA